MGGNCHIKHEHTYAGVIALLLSCFN